MNVGRQLYSDAVLTLFPVGDVTRSFMVLSLTTVCLIRWNSDRDQEMAPAMGGWFLEMGGLFLCPSKRSRMVSI